MHRVPLLPLLECDIGFLCIIDEFSTIYGWTLEIGERAFTEIHLLTRKLDSQLIIVIRDTREEKWNSQLDGSQENSTWMPDKRRKQPQQQKKTRSRISRIVQITVGYTFQAFWYWKYFNYEQIDCFFLALICAVLTLESSTRQLRYHECIKKSLVLRFVYGWVSSKGDRVVE